MRVSVCFPWFWAENFWITPIFPKLLPVSPEMARYHAMLGVEIGVGFTVTAIMFALYASLSTDGRMQDGL